MIQIHNGVEMDDVAARIIASLANLDFVHDFDAESGKFRASSPKRGWMVQWESREFAVSIKKGAIENEMAELQKEAISHDHLKRMRTEDAIATLLGEMLEEAVISAMPGVTRLTYRDLFFR